MSDDEGGVTVVGAVIALVMMLAALAVVMYASAVATRYNARAAADAAALAGAVAFARADTDACQAAEDIAGLNGAALQRCVVRGSDLVATVWVPLPIRIPGYSGVTASARAGPFEVAH
ncbi:flp pilus-assembly TadE/G-like family protein [Hoyosella sp. YIM 151337]|uniref:Rv3654c family TadE-like protein n=1 Tax=Hoyosella sp. YIM 151337 TaxID=2992742 RepID=UPI002235871C|nr:Rv3654c family TadE-like protein [Hoyosella sp. YIM 151337]MCW4352727.1 flp pilus-assembly TadE/G-like family protein [Hoyosella sp. YIM 151337]